MTFSYQYRTVRKDVENSSRNLGGKKEGKDAYVCIHSKNVFVGRKVVIPEHVS